MQVLTFDDTRLDSACKRLALMVMADGKPYYDAIVAVRRGGAFVCDSFCRYFPHERYGNRFDITLQRPSTKKKGKFFRRLLQSLPYPVLDALRIFESYLLRFQSRKGNAKPIPNVEIPDEMEVLLHSDAFPSLLVIDDAIDSGETLLALVDKIKGLNHDATIDIAVLTVTTTSPRINAAFSLYHDKTLIRFPWSDDFKGVFVVNSDEEKERLWKAKASESVPTDSKDI